MAAKDTAPILSGTPQYYLNHIAQYERGFDKWKARADKIIKRYKDESRDVRTGDGSRFNILWSNVQTLKSATFSRIPKADVSRRFKDNDPIGRVAALILERALQFELDHYDDFARTLQECVYDRFLCGRGTAWVRYEPTFTEIDDDGSEITEDVETEDESNQELEFENAPTDYVHWTDFGHEVARTWEECGIVWRKVYLTRQALTERFGDEISESIPLDASPQDKASRTDPDGVTSRALIYEIWDKYEGKAFWLSKTLKRFIDEKEDPLELEGFFPCPRPIYATLTTDSLVPIPDYAMYQDQAIQLDVLSDRIDGLVKALQVKGVYDSAVPELARLFAEAQNGDLIPVKNWAAFAEKAGLKGAVDLVDLTPIASALNEAFNTMHGLKDQIYEITGISDILRGQTMASETATAQQIKNQYATLRLKTYQDEVAYFSTGLLRKKAEIICKHFSDETILKMSGAATLTQQDQQAVPMAIQMLRSDPMRVFMIEVAADSLLYMDEQQEKQDRMEFLNATSMFIEKLVQAGQMAPQVLELGVEMLKFGVTGFRVGKGLEGVIDQAADQLRQQQAQQQSQPPQPNPDQLKAQSDQAVQQARMQADQAIQQAKMQSDMQIEAMRQNHEQQMDSLQKQFDVIQQRNEHNLQILLAEIKARSAVEVAELSSATTLTAQQMSAAQSASQE